MSLVLGLGLEHSCPWPREGLSSKRLSLALASDFFCVLGLGLGLEPCVLDSTSANDALSAILFQPITVRLFPIAIPFPVLSILTILLDKQLMKSFENINILIKVKLVCWKKFFFQKSFYLKKDCHLKEKNFFGKNLFL